jgi:hypothetical protein
MMKRLVAAALLTVAFTVTARAEVIQFSDDKTNSRLAAWTVWIDGKERGITDSNGRFRINDPTGNIAVVLKHPSTPDRTVKVTVAGKPRLVEVRVP